MLATLLAQSSSTPREESFRNVFSQHGSSSNSNSPKGTLGKQSSFPALHGSFQQLETRNKGSPLSSSGITESTAGETASSQHLSFDSKEASFDGGSPPTIETSKSFPQPKNLDSLVHKDYLGGSTGAELVKDKATNTLYVKKSGANPQHLKSEYLANKSLKALGTPVPDVGLYYDSLGAPTMLAQFFEGSKALGDVLTASGYRPSSSPDKQDGATSEKAEVLRDKVKSHLVAHALVGNYDVVGANYNLDNVRVDRNGNPQFVDNGSSFLYSAIGNKKADEHFTDEVTELDTLRGIYNSRNPGALSHPAIKQAATIFSDTPKHEIM